MAANPSFASTPRIGVGAVSTANTNRDGTGTIVDVITGAAAGTKVFEVVTQATNDPADCTIMLFLNDGTTNWLFDEIDIGNPTAASATQIGDRQSRSYANLVLPSNTWKLRAAITAAPTAGVVNVFAFAGDMT